MKPAISLDGVACFYRQPTVATQQPIDEATERLMVRDKVRVSLAVARESLQRASVMLNREAHRLNAIKQTLHAQIGSLGGARVSDGVCDRARLDRPEKTHIDCGHLSIDSRHCRVPWESLTEQKSSPTHSTVTAASLITTNHNCAVVLFISCSKHSTICIHVCTTHNCVSICSAVDL